MKKAYLHIKDHYIFKDGLTYINIIHINKDMNTTKLELHELFGNHYHQKDPCHFLGRKPDAFIRASAFQQ
jgi:hypothetical protein